MTQAVETNCRIINDLGDERTVLEIYHKREGNVGGVRISKRVEDDYSRSDMEFRWEPVVEELDRTIGTFGQLRMFGGTDMGIWEYKKMGISLYISEGLNPRRIGFLVYDGDSRYSVEIGTTDEGIVSFYDSLKLLSRLMKGKSA